MMELLKAKYRSPGQGGNRGFEDLDCYKLALDVMVNAHQVADALPAHEKFDMAAQNAALQKASPQISLRAMAGIIIWMHFVSILLRVVR